MTSAAEETAADEDRGLGDTERPCRRCVVMTFFLGDLVVSVCGCCIDEVSDAGSGGKPQHSRPCCCLLACLLVFSEVVLCRWVARITLSTSAS